MRLLIGDDLLGDRIVLGMRDRERQRQRDEREMSRGDKN
jgi:hypothetical protein